MRLIAGMEQNDAGTFKQLKKQTNKQTFIEKETNSTLTVFCLFACLFSNTYPRKYLKVAVSYAVISWESCFTCYKLNFSVSGFPNVLPNT